MRGSGGFARQLPRQQPPNRLLHRPLEADTGQQHGVTQKRMQLSEIDRPAVRQVDVGIGRDPHRNRRHLHETGVGRLLTAQYHHRLARATQPIETATQQLRRAEDAGHDQVTCLERLS